MRKIVGIAILIFARSALGRDFECGGNAAAYSQLKRSDEVDLIIGGEDARYGEWPSMAIISYKGYNLCGAVFIHIEGFPPEWILTAAHCLSSIRSKDKAKILLGVTNTHDENPDTYAIEEMYPHPEFKRTKDCQEKGAAFDIALIKISGKIVMKEGIVQWACLPRRNQLKILYDDEQVARANCHAIGFGIFAEGKQAKARHLQQIRIEHFPQCNKAYPNCYTEKQICWGERGAQSCVGDSGGPLLCQLDGKWTVAGISSRVMGSKCDEGAVYVNVGDMTSWIEETMKKS